MRAGLAVLLMLLGAAASASAGAIRGTVTLTRPGDAERTVVYVEKVPDRFVAAPTLLARLSQKGSRFNPAVLPIVRGTSVDMTNDDWVSHNVFSKSPAKTFDLGLYAQDGRKVVAFDKLGAVSVFCSIHARMNAVVLVLQNPFFAKPAPNGSFRIEGVPEGSWSLRVYRPDGSLSEPLEVKVPASGDVPAAF